MNARTVRGLACTLALAVAVSTAGCTNADDGTSADPGASTVSTRVSEPTTSTVPEPVRASDGCRTTPPDLGEPEASGDVPLEFDLDGATRTYRLGVPADAAADEQPMGLILNLHGSGSDAIQQSIYTDMAARGTERGYVVVTPDAVDGVWELSGEGADDDFLMALLDDLGSRYCIDLDRVHAAGISLGSWKATATACTHPDRIASIVLVAEQVAPTDCAMPVVSMHGTADASVPYGAGADDGVVVTGPNAGLPGVEVNMPNWARQAGCSVDKDVTPIGDDVEHWVYHDCPAGFDVEFYRIDGGGHTWPGASLDITALGATTTTIDATAIALDWFDAHPLRR